MIFIGDCGEREKEYKRVRQQRTLSEMTNANYSIRTLSYFNCAGYVFPSSFPFILVFAFHFPHSVVYMCYVYRIGGRCHPWNVRLSFLHAAIQFACKKSHNDRMRGGWLAEIILIHRLDTPFQTQNITLLFLFFRFSSCGFLVHRTWLLLLCFMAVSSQWVYVQCCHK